MLTDPFSDADSSRRETVDVRVATRDDAGAVDDAPTPATLTETEVGSGVFVSETMLMVTHDLPSVGHAARDDNEDVVATSPSPDESFGDRTHRALPDGWTVIRLPDFDVPFETPVCARVPEERRVLEYRPVVLEEPFIDIGADHDQNPATPWAGVLDDRYQVGEPFIDISSGNKHFAFTGTWGRTAEEARIDADHRATAILFAQACLRVERLKTKVIVYKPSKPPLPFLRERGDVLFPDDIPEVWALFASLGDPPAVPRLLYLGKMAWGGSLTAGMALISRRLSEEGGGAVVDVTMPIDFPVHAHELGHILTNRSDEVVAPHYFFPLSGVWPVVAANQGRRLTAETIGQVRTRRAAGDFGGVGNRMLFPPGGSP